MIIWKNGLRRRVLKAFSLGGDSGLHFNGCGTQPTFSFLIAWPIVTRRIKPLQILSIFSPQTLSIKIFLLLNRQSAILKFAQTSVDNNVLIFTSSDKNGSVLSGTEQRCSLFVLVHW